MSSWVNPYYLNSNVERNIVIQGRTSEISAMPYSLLLNSSRFGISTFTDAGWQTASTNYVSTTISLKKWTLLTITRMNQTLFYYKDGVYLGSNTFSGTPTSNTNGFLVGKGFNGGTFYFPGLIDEVRVYNRALSASEVKALYNMGR